MFFKKKTPQAEETIHEVNMVPLVDVSLVLVVILMLATPLALESSIAVRKSQASARQAEVKMKAERIELNIVSEDNVLVNRILVRRNKLGMTLRPLLEKSDLRQVVVVCADDVPHGAFVDVLDQAKMCGAVDIAVTGR